MIESELGKRFRFLMKDGPEATDAQKVKDRTWIPPRCPFSRSRKAAQLTLRE